MGVTHKLINKVTVGSGGASTVTFNSIPQTYTDLRLIISSRNTGTSNGISILFNGVNTNQSNKRIYANGSSVPSYSGSDIIVYMNNTNHTANVFDSVDCYIANYTIAYNKPVLIENITETDGPGNEMALIGGLWADSAAITSITLSVSGNNFAQNSTFQLYGIKNS